MQNHQNEVKPFSEIYNFEADKHTMKELNTPEKKIDFRPSMPDTSLFRDSRNINEINSLNNHPLHNQNNFLAEDSSEFEGILNNKNYFPNSPGSIYSWNNSSGATGGYSPSSWQGKDDKISFTLRAQNENKDNNEKLEMSEFINKQNKIHDTYLKVSSRELSLLNYFSKKHLNIDLNDRKFNFPAYTSFIINSNTQGNLNSANPLNIYKNILQSSENISLNNGIKEKKEELKKEQKEERKTEENEENKTEEKEDNKNEEKSE